MRLLGSVPGACGRLAAAAALSLGHSGARVRCNSTTISGISTSTKNMSLPARQVEHMECIAARQRLVQCAPVQVLRIKGVSFENRQAAVEQLVPGQPVVLEKQPSHPQDPGAVAISTLDGTQLGFVSRHLKDAFQLPVCFGSVASVGSVLTSDLLFKWGAQVSCSPALWGMSLDLLPHSWEHQIDLQALLQSKHPGGLSAAQREYDAQVLAAYQQRCAVTGLPATESPLQLVPRWLFDHHKVQVQLNPHEPFVPMCQPLVQLQQMAQEGLDTVSLAERQSALELLQWVNRWTEHDCTKYLEYVEQRRQQVENEGWSLSTLLGS